MSAIRSRVICKLLDVRRGTLQYWHKTFLSPAHARPGRRGVPRLWSWSDYMKVRAIAKLKAKGLHVRQIREAIDFLDVTFPEWPTKDLYLLGKQVLVAFKPGTLLSATDGAQLASADILGAVLESLQREGPLGALSSFADTIDMRPEVLAGNPTIKGRRIEPQLIVTLVDSGEPPETVANAYGLTVAQVERALAFGRRLAAAA